MWSYPSWRPLTDLWREAERALDPWLRLPRAIWRGSSNFPPVRITATDSELVLTAEVPGVQLADLELDITGDTLTIKGERRPDETVPDASFHRRERLMGHFARSVTLPERVDPSQIKAACANGILRVVMPKAAEARSRKIEIEGK